MKFLITSDAVRVEIEAQNADKAAQQLEVVLRAFEAKNNVRRRFAQQENKPKSIKIESNS